MLEIPFYFFNHEKLGRPSFDIPQIQKFTVADRTGRIDKIGHKKTDSKRLESVFLAAARKAKSFSFFHYAYVWKLYY